MVFPKKVKAITKEQAYLKACAFCSYQERTQLEVREKLYGLGIEKDLIEELISQLIIDNFLNEERFAKAYAGGKFRIKKWGKIKILQGLKEKGLSEYCIKKGLEEITEEDYLKTLNDLVNKKWELVEEENIFKKKNKVATYLIGKGYESDVVWQILNREFK